MEFQSEASLYRKCYYRVNTFPFCGFDYPGFAVRKRRQAFSVLTTDYRSRTDSKRAAGTFIRLRWRVVTIDHFYQPTSRGAAAGRGLG